MFLLTLGYIVLRLKYLWFCVLPRDGAMWLSALNVLLSCIANIWGVLSSNVALGSRLGSLVPWGVLGISGRGHFALNLRSYCSPLLCNLYFLYGPCLQFLFAVECFLSVGTSCLSISAKPYLSIQIWGLRFKWPSKKNWGNLNATIMHTFRIRHWNLRFLLRFHSWFCFRCMRRCLGSLVFSCVDVHSPLLLAIPCVFFFLLCDSLDCLRAPVR